MKRGARRIPPRDNSYRVSWYRHVSGATPAGEIGPSLVLTTNLFAPRATAPHHEQHPFQPAPPTTRTAWPPQITRQSVLCISINSMLPFGWVVEPSYAGYRSSLPELCGGRMGFRWLFGANPCCGVSRTCLVLFVDGGVSCGGRISLVGYWTNSMGISVFSAAFSWFISFQSTPLASVPFFHFLSLSCLSSSLFTYPSFPYRRSPLPPSPYPPFSYRHSSSRRSPLLPSPPSFPSLFVLSPLFTTRFSITISLLISSHSPPS